MGKNVRNGINTDFISKDNTLNTKIETSYSAKVGDENFQSTENKQIDEQIEAINFNGPVNTGGGGILLRPIQTNSQTPNLQSTSNQTISITHGK